MSDLVDRLRAVDGCSTKTRIDAADEIERLREKLDADRKSGMTITDDDIEKVAAAWASIDGKKDRFWACKADQAIEDEEGRYEGYMADAKELMLRSGLFTYTDKIVLRPDAAPQEPPQ